MEKISVSGYGYSAVYAREDQLTALFNSLVKMMLTSFFTLVVDLVTVKKSTPQLYKRESVIKSNQILLVKEAQENEADKLIQYVNRISKETSFLSFDSQVNKISINNEKKNIRKCRDSEHHVLLIGWLKDEIVGYLAFRSNLWQRLRNAGEFAFSVSKKNWGLGIGSQIMQSLLEWAGKSNAIKTIEFRVRSDNKRAIAVYRKLGFTKKRSLLWRPFDYIVMKLTVS